MKNILKFIISIVICELTGIIGSFFTTPAIGGWYATLNKPSFNPSNWIFGPVWTILFFLMGISLFLAWRKNWASKVQVIPPAGGRERKAWNPWSEKLWTGSWREENAVAIFTLQLILNILWSALFFGLKLSGLAFFELLMLWFAILYTIINFYRISKPAAWLLLPYIFWVSFAAVLNFAIWRIN